MNDPKTTNQKNITPDEVIESYKVLRVWHNSTCFISAFMMICMIGAVIWGISFPEYRFTIIVAGAVLGICGAVLFIVVHRLYIKTSVTLLEYFKAVCKMSDSKVLEKAQELKIPKKALSAIGK